jgi:hypothetical protein
VGSDLGLDLGNSRERCVPARFEFAGHETVGGIGRVILTGGAIGGVPRRFEVAIQRVANGWR